MRIRNRPILAAVCASALSFQTAAALSPRQIRWTYRESSISFLRSPQASRNRDEDFNNDKDQWSTTRLSTSTDYEIVDNDDDDEKMAVSWQKQSRRRLLLLKPLRAVTTLLPLLLLRPASTSARGLVQFPCKTPLANNYHLMRAGTTMLEEEGKHQK